MGGSGYGRRKKEERSTINLFNEEHQEKDRTQRNNLVPHCRRLGERAKNDQDMDVVSYSHIDDAKREQLIARQDRNTYGPLTEMWRVIKATKHQAWMHLS